MSPYWEQVQGDQLEQGDHLADCVIPRLPETFVETAVGDEARVRVRALVQDLMILTQSCDIEQRKTDWIVTCPVFTRAEFED